MSNVAELPEKPGHKRSELKKRQNMAEYLEWYTTPESERMPKTKEAFASLLGVTSTTLRNYEKERWFQVQVMARKKGALKVERLDDIIASLVDIATARYTDRGAPSGPSVSAAKVLLDWMDRSVETLDDDPSSMTDDELVRVYRALKTTLEDAGLLDS